MPEKDVGITVSIKVFFQFNMLRKSNMVFGRFLIPELLSQFIADQAVLVGYSSLSAQIYLEWLRARERGRKYALSTAQFDDAVIEKFRQ